MTIELHVELCNKAALIVGLCCPGLSTVTEELHVGLLCTR